MHKLLIELLKNKLVSILQKSKKDRILLVFVGNNRMFYDNFSFYVLKYFKANLPQTNLTLFCCYAKNGIYGASYAKLKQMLSGFSGLVLFIDSGICTCENELGLFKILNSKVLSLADFDFLKNGENLFANNNEQRFVSIVYYSLNLKSGRFINEQAKRKAAQFISSILCHVLAKF